MERTPFRSRMERTPFRSRMERYGERSVLTRAYRMERYGVRSRMERYGERSVLTRAYRMERYGVRSRMERYGERSVLTRAWRRGRGAVAQIHVVNLHICQAQIFHRQLVGIVARIDDSYESRVDNHFGARVTRLMRGVNGAAFEGHAVQRGLQNRILF